MPGLDYKHNVPVTGVWASRTKCFYNGADGREVVKCPDCGHKADALFGDHGGQCLDFAAVATPNSALGLIRRHALHNRRFSSNDLRAAFDQAGIPPNSRGPAWGAAKRKEWIRDDGHTPSLAEATKGHDVKTYESLIFIDGKQS